MQGTIGRRLPMLRDRLGKGERYCPRRPRGFYPMLAQALTDTRAPAPMAACWVLSMAVIGLEEEEGSKSSRG